VRAGRPRVPKKEVAINPINPRGGLGCSLCLMTKIEHISLNFRPFEAAFSGIGRDSCSAGAGIFFVFYFANFYLYTFRTS